MLRANFCACIVGKPGTGKTTLIKKILKPFFNKFKILVYDPLLQLSEFNPNIITDISDVKLFANAIYVFDDATGVFALSNIPKNILQVITTRRHYNNYLIFVFHSLQYTPVHITTYCDTFFLFPTSDRQDIIKQKTSLLNLPPPPSQPFKPLLVTR